MRTTLRRVGVLVAAVTTAVVGTVVVANQASAAAAMTLDVVTANVAFHGPDSVRRQWRTIGAEAEIVFVQEAKNVVLRDILGKEWIVRQNTSSEDKAGSAVVIRRSIVQQMGDFELVLGVNGQPEPCKIMKRWIAKVNFQLTNGRWLRVASLHMPPHRCQTGPGSPYAIMADNVVAFANRTNRLTILGADWNKVVDDDPNNIGGRTGLKPRGPNVNDGDGRRIDGFYVSKAITTCCLHYLADTASDHTPVQMRVTIPAP